MKILPYLKKLWRFYWNGDSLWSYIFFIAVTIVLFKLILFPLFLKATGLSDVVAIMSASMEHSGNENEYFYSYFENKNFTKQEIDKFPFSKGLNIGDVLFVKKEENYSVGDVIVFKSPLFPYKLVHRVIGLNPIRTKGDNNEESFAFDNNINEVIGKAIFKIPYLGLPRYWLYRIFGI